MTKKRFKYSSTTQIITDDLTGYTYYGNKKVCDLLNQLNDDADKKIAKLIDENFDCKKQINEYKNIIRSIIFQVEYEQSYSTPICKITVQVDPKMYKTLTEMITERTRKLRE